MSTTTQNTPTSYGEAAEVLGSRDDLKIANNTTLERIGCTIGVRLHQTVVVSFGVSGDVYLNSGGWQTTTTKERINRYLPAGVSLQTVRGTWQVTDRRGGKAVVVEFSDGMVIQS